MVLVQCVRTALIVVLLVVGWQSLSMAEARELPDFVQLAEDNSPAVVNIGTSVKNDPKEPAPQLQIPDIPEDSPLHDFFKKFFGEGMEGPDLTPRSSLGSGFIISNDGYVISNFHVVKDADEIIVRLSDRREFVAKVIGSDERSDLSVLKIE
ncbi:MAG: trypsin-like peptidase domain-containing protein, partial [Gammaproteobacteria bacterium]